MNTTSVEYHPLQPFLPAGARLLMLGSFPPPHARWCMDFFYPNPQNDMWRIMGQVFYGDKMRFVEERAKTAARMVESTAEQIVQSEAKTDTKTAFLYEAIVDFCTEKGIAIFDTAQAVRRLQNNAADEHLEIVEPTDIAALLHQIPECHDVCCTGQKAADTLAALFGCSVPKVGSYVEVEFPVQESATTDCSFENATPNDSFRNAATTCSSATEAEHRQTIRHLRFWRMPSSSRAYPLSLDKKAAAYRLMMQTIGMD